jgi:hypothetical protein
MVANLHCDTALSHSSERESKSEDEIKNEGESESEDEEKSENDAFASKYRAEVTVNQSSHVYR